MDSSIASGTSRSQSKDVGAQITEHRYDVLGNRIQTILPTGEILNRLYYGSGHLHHVNLDGSTLTDIERDALHRPVERTLGKLNTQFQLDPLGRLKQQITQPNGHNKADPAVLIGRRYQYDTTGNLIRTDDQTNGNRDYTYDALGRITQCADEHYRYDPAHNLTDGSRIGGNRLTQYKGISYRYDPLGNLIEKQHNNGEIHHYRYNADNQLTEAEIHKPGESPVQYRYRYDSIGRRIAKVHPNGNEIQYLWDGSRLLQEYRKDRTYTYVYTEDQNYEPLAQITTYNGSDKAREILYYHNDQIGIPREMTDGEGNIVWSGDYSGWGKLTREERLKSDIYQPIRLQNQHYDEETGLHYNFFRYYDPDIGRFTQQDPIGLEGGSNFYQFSTNIQNMMDPWGLNAVGIAKGALSMIAIDTMTPDPTDAAFPKWIAYGVLGAAATGVVALSESDTCTGKCQEEKTYERYTTRPYRLVVIKMISNDIQELLKNITKSLIKIETKELDVLISRQLTHIDNIDFHRYEISHREIGSLKFSFCSFRGTFISYSSFTNCNFINCSFITAIVCNTKFTNCTFINCVFRSMHIQDNLISNCSFQNCYIEDNIFSTNKT